VVGLRAERVPLDVGERLRVGAGIERGAAGQAVVLGLDLAAEVALDVAARLDPWAAELGKAGVDVDRRGGVGVRAAGVVDADRGLVRGRLEHDLAHRDSEVGEQLPGDVDLAAARQRAGGDLHLRGRVWHFDRGVDVGHASYSNAGARAGSAATPSLRRGQPDQVQRVAALLRRASRLSAGRTGPPGTRMY